MARMTDEKIKAKKTSSKGLEMEKLQKLLGAAFILSQVNTEPQIPLREFTHWSSRFSVPGAQPEG